MEVAGRVDELKRIKFLHERLGDDSEHGKLSRGIKRVVDVTRARAGKLGHNVEWVFGRRVARALGVVVLFAVVVALLLVFLNWYVAPTKPSDKKDLVLALAQILAGTALLSGLYFTWRTLQVNREGQITERFTRAVDQLGKTDDKGNKLFEIRLGAIYALERIARESEEDHWPIMEILTAYVRQHARWLPGEGQEGTEDAAVENSEGDLQGKSGVADVSTPDPDIQAIMTVLRRRTRYLEHGEPEPLDLRETDLRGVNLWGANLTGANLQGANLSGAILWRTNLSGAYLWGANLTGANLSGASLTGATLIEANLSGAHLDRASLSGASLSGASLSGASLWKATLSGRYIWISETDFTGADLTGADLQHVSLSGATGLTQEQIDSAIGDMMTSLPEGRVQPTSWRKSTEEEAKYSKSIEEEAKNSKKRWEEFEEEAQNLKKRWEQELKDE